MLKMSLFKLVAVGQRRYLETLYRDNYLFRIQGGCPVGTRPLDEADKAIRGSTEIACGATFRH